jgi:rhodanese-related sulfurtransferase
MSVPLLITSETLKFLLAGSDSIGLLDVREEGEYNGAHIPGSVCVPRRLLEIRAPQLFPFKGIQLVVCDDNGGRAARSCQTLQDLGYERVAMLSGGVNRWFSEDFPVEWGINVPNKDFGERVEVCDHVPTWNAIELSRRIASGENLKIFDTRTSQEFKRFSIPGAECIPNVEIARWAHDIRHENPKATIVVNCGGRTRSIIGARTLLRMGLTGVVSLKNGTSGWALAGFDVEFGNPRVRQGSPSAVSLQSAEAAASAVAREDGVELIGIDTLDALSEQAKSTTVYFVDVRTREEYLQGHIPGFIWFPGGQTIQRSDDVAPVRNSPIVFCCDGIARAAITASWFRQMGFPRVMALHGGVAAWQGAKRALETADPFELPFGFDAIAQKTRRITARHLQDAISAGEIKKTFFVGTSREFADGHIPGACWISRSKLDLLIGAHCPDKNAAIALSAADSVTAVLAANDLQKLGYTGVVVLDGEMKAWADQALPIETGLTGVMVAPEDILPTIPNRSFENMMNYLSWEESLGRKYSA